MDKISEQIAAAIAAHEATHHLEIREGRAAVELVEMLAGKPVAGEWVAPWEGNSAARKFGGSDAVITVWRFPGEQKFHWRVWMLADAGTKLAEEDTAADYQRTRERARALLDELLALGAPKGRATRPRPLVEHEAEAMERIVMAMTGGAK